MNLVYDINFDIAGLITLILLRIILKAQYTLTSKANKTFRLVVDFSILTTSLDIITAITISYSSNIPGWVNLLLNTGYFLTSFFCTYVGTKYIFETLNWYPKGLKLHCRGILYIYVLLIIVNLFTGIIFDFKGGTYNKGPLYLCTFFSNLLLLFTVSISFLTKKSIFNKRKLILSSSFVFMPFIFVIFQFIFPNELLTSFCTALVVLVMTFTLETPDFLELEYLRKFLESEVEQQTKTVIEREKQIESMSVEVVQALAEAIDEKDVYTKGHSIRVAQYAVMIGKEIGLSEEKLQNLKVASLLHDVGKIGIPDEVLQKPSRLTPEEFEIIKTHSTKGGKILHNVSSIPYAEAVALHHHERYDGKGYPDGLSGSDIPFFSRIVAICDSYDAMSTRRVYRDPLSRELIREQLINGRGTQFDPELLDTFLNLFESEQV